jgi:hypothetical protein
MTHALYAHMNNKIKKKEKRKKKRKIHVSFLEAHLSMSLSPLLWPQGDRTTEREAKRNCMKSQAVWWAY